MADNTIQILILAQNLASDILESVGNDSNTFGQNLVNTGTQVTTATAGIAAGLAVATASAISYDSAMTNTAAVLGLTADAQAVLASEILDFGRGTLAGPQAVAEAYYDIVGGVADATTHMAILEAATETAEAGAADLTGTTAGLVSVMNSYGFSAEQATYASDVMTQTVSDGVGTMDEFAAALPQVTGLANSLGISFEDVGGSMAYMTTQGFSASQAATQLRSMMTAVLNPNERMKEALAELGVASGQAAIEQYGLVGAFEMISETAVVAENGLAATLGSTEALTGAIALGSENAAAALDDFSDSMAGATDRARAIQLTSAANQMKLFQSSIAGISIQIGEALIPSMNRILEAVMPILEGVFEWIAANPDLTAGLVGVASALTIIGPLMMAIGAGIGIITSPITLVIAGLAALGVAFATNFGGIRDAIQPVVTLFENAVNAITVSFGNFTDTVDQGGSIIDGILSVIVGAVSNLMLTFGLINGDQFVVARDAIANALGGVVDVIEGTVIPTLMGLVDWFINTGLPLAVMYVQTIVIPAFMAWFDFLGSVWAMVGPALQNLSDWFLNTALPAMTNMVTNSIMPAIQAFAQTLSDIWAVVQPALLSLADWFLNTALPAVTNFITGTVIPIVQGLIDGLVRLWTDVSPFLVFLFDWFVNTALPTIVSFIETVVVPVVQTFIDILTSIWTAIQPTLIALYDWFIVTGLPIIQDMIEVVSGVVQALIDVIAAIWAGISPILTLVFDWFVTNGMPVIGQAIDGVIQWIEFFADTISHIWDVISPGVASFSSGITSAFNWLSTNVIQPILELIQSVINGINNALNVVRDVAGQIAATISSIDLNLFDSNGLIFNPWADGGMFNRDVGGQGMPGKSYAIGTGAQPEVFIPNQPGSFIPNFDDVAARAMGKNNGGSGGSSYQINVTVSERDILSPSEAMANGEMFGQRLLQEINYRG